MSNLHALSSDELPKIVIDFFSNFKCDPIFLANHLAHWGCEVKPTITLVIGSGNTGSSALIQFAHTLYSPFTCHTSFTSSSIHNSYYNLIRTSFVDDYGDVPDEETVRSHPCNHLVITANHNIINSDSYGGRRVRRLIFNGPIDNPDSNILRQICIPENLKHALAWILTHCSSSDFLHLTKQYQYDYHYSESSDKIGCSPDKKEEVSS